MQISDIILSISAFLGPVTAVCITLWWDSRRKKHELKLSTLRDFISTRGTPADPTYSLSVKLIPLAFADCHRVLSAFKEYHASTTPTSIDGLLTTQQLEALNTKQRILITEMLKSVGYKSFNADSLPDYISRGQTDRQTLIEKALASLPEIAEASKLSASAATEIVELSNQNNSAKV